MSLKGFTTINESTLTNDIVENLISYFDWGLINKDNFISVNIPTTGTYGGNDHVLSYVDDPRFTNGQVWQMMRGNLVWESGLDSSTQPLVSSDSSYPGVSGVYIDDVFYPTSTTGVYAHHIDHLNGQVVFDTAISTTSSVSCEYSYKYITVEKAGGLNWFKRIQINSERSDEDTPYLLRDNTVQLPVIGIEVTNDRSFKGYQLGGGSFVKTSILFHCIAEDPYTRDFLVDMVSYQNESVLTMYDLNSIDSNNAFPINNNGVPVSGALTYDEIVSQYPYRALRLTDMKIDSIYTLGNIFVGTVKCSTEVILGV